MAAFAPPARYEPRHYLSDAAILRRAETLDARQRASLAESLAGNIKSHAFYVVHADNPVAPPAPDAPDLVPVPANVDLAQLAKSVGSSGAITATVDGLPFRMALPRLAAPSAHVFGIGTPVEIEAVMASPIEQPRTANGRGKKANLPALWPRQSRLPSILDLVSREELPVPNPESFGYSTVPALPAVPQKRAALPADAPALGDLRGSVKETDAAETTGAIGPRPGSWPVTTASMPKAGFP